MGKAPFSLSRTQRVEVLSTNTNGSDKTDIEFWQAEEPNVRV